MLRRRKTVRKASSATVEHGIDPISIERHVEICRRLAHPLDVPIAADDDAVFELHRLQQIERRQRRQAGRLAQRLRIFRIRRRIPRDAAADAEFGAAGVGVDRSGTNRDVENRVAGRRNESNRAAIHAARRMLDRCDQPHAAALRRARDRSGRKQRAEHIRQRRALAQRAFDGRNQLKHRRISLDFEQRHRPHRSDLRDASDVVAREVDDHHVLGAVLLRRRQPRRPLLVFFTPSPARRRALHRLRGDPPAANLEEQLRRQRQHAPAAQIQIRGIRRALRLRELEIARVQIDSAGRRRRSPPTARSIDVGSQAERVVHLIRVAARDRLLHSVDARAIVVRRDVRFPSPRRRSRSATRATLRWQRSRPVRCRVALRMRHGVSRGPRKRPNQTSGGCGSVGRARRLRSRHKRVVERGRCFVGDVAGRVEALTRALFHRAQRGDHFAHVVRDDDALRL